MENNNYGQVIYNPYTNRYEVPQNPLRQPYPTPQPQQQLRQYAFVNGVEGAKSYQLVPNSSIMLMDAEANICYKKECDNTGRASIRYFKLEEIDEAEARNITQPVKVTTPEYVSKAEFDALSEKIDDLLKKLDKPKSNYKPPKED